MSLHIDLPLLNVLLQLSISLVLCPGQLQHGLSNRVRYSLEQMYLMSLGEFALLLVSLVQGVLEGLVVLAHQEVQGVLHHQEVLHHQGSSISIRGSSSWVSSSCRGSSISMGIFSSRGSSIRISSSLRQSPTLVWISPSLRGSLISMWPSIIIIIAISSWIFPPS